MSIYFFKTSRQRNQQGEWRQVMKLVEGQSMFDSSTRSVTSAHDYTVQTNLAMTSLRCSLPDGTIFAARIIGSTPRRRSLPVHSRNGVSYYVLGDNVLIPESQFDNPENEDILQEYNRLVAYNNSSIFDNASSDDESENQSEQPSNQMAVPDITPNANWLISTKEMINRIVETNRGSLPVDKIIAISSCLDLMNQGVVKFNYVKSDGSLRMAYGTRNSDVISHYNGDAGSASRMNNDESRFNNTISYFDIVAMDWRSFSISRFQGLESSVVTSFSQIAQLVA